MCVCLCVCMYVCMCIYYTHSTHIIHANILTHTHTHTHSHIHTYAHRVLGELARENTVLMCTLQRSDLLWCPHLISVSSVCSMCVCVYALACILMRIQADTHACTNTHIYAHIRTWPPHVHMLRRGRGGNGDAVHANALLVIMRAHAKGGKGGGCVCARGGTLIRWHPLSTSRVL